MLLAAALHDHLGPLRASFRAVYHLPIQGHGLSLTEFSELVGSLPAGCAFWQSFGGPLARTEEAWELLRVEFRLRRLEWQQTEDGRKGRNAPQPPEHVPYAHEKRAEESVELSRAAKWRKRQSRS